MGDQLNSTASLERVVSQTKLKSILKKTFGFDEFKFEQERIVNSVLCGRDTLAIMPTGGGKSLCYQLPALYLEGLTLVISPLISLMQDQVNALKQYDIEAAYLNSSLDYQERLEIEERVKNNKIRILYLAPEGLVSGSVLSIIKAENLSLIAIDEAHCVSQWGHEFRKDYQSLHVLKQHFPNTPTIALTATADDKTRDDICNELALKDARVFVSSFDRPNIRYEILERENELKQLQKFIKEKHPDDTGIVYCLSRKKVEKVSDELKRLGHNCVPYHAGLSSTVRARHQRRFDMEDNLIVVATIAFGMGIDRPDVRFVAHLDLPKSIEGYYQETGRAGRDGQPANAWMVYGLADVMKLSRMLEQTDADQVYKKAARFKLDRMLSLCESLTCRRQILLGYFGQHGSEPCGNCDACLNPLEGWDATVEAQKILSAIYRTGQMFGAGYVIDVLRGSSNERILGRGHDKLSVYGIGKDLSKNDWNAIVRQLLNLGYIYIKDWDYKNLALTQSSREILTGSKRLTLRKLREGVSFSKKTKQSDISHSHGRDDLFSELKALRLSIAKESKVPPYVVFSDKTLHDMCQILPQNDSDFLMVNGVGQSKLEKYGKAFLKVISENKG